MYIFGGRDELSPYRSYNDLFSLDLGAFFLQLFLLKTPLGALNWRQIACKGKIPGPRDSTSMVENNGNLYIFGGVFNDDICSNETFSLDLEGSLFNKFTL